MLYAIHHLTFSFQDSAYISSINSEADIFRGIFCRAAFVRTEKIPVFFCNINKHAQRHVPVYRRLVPGENEQAAAGRYAGIAVIVNGKIF